MNRFLIAALTAVLGATCAGCYFSSPPAAPHGHTPPQVDQTAALSVLPAPLRLSSPHVLIVARFDSAATQPIGGLYDFNDYETSPLVRTYYFKHADLELFEHTCDALRATGLDVRKDYATTGEPTLVERPLRQLQPLIVRTRILSMQHDQIRTDSDPPTDNEVVQLQVEVSVVDVQGVSHYQARHEIKGRLAWQENLDVLRMLGLKLGETLARDTAFQTALGAKQGGA